MMAASIATIATTQTISMRVKPSSPRTRSALPACDVRGSPGAALLSVGAVRDDVVGAVLARQAVDVGIAPWVGRDDVSFQIGPVPGHGIAGTLHQGRQALRTRRIAAGVEEVEVERAGKARDLDSCRLGLGVTEIVEHAGPDETHD